MQRLQAFKFQLMPDGEQQHSMRRFAGSCRYVYNKALALQKENHKAGKPFVGYVPMAANLPIWKREVGQEWLQDAPPVLISSANFRHVMKRAKLHGAAPSWIRSMECLRRKECDSMVQAP